MVALYKLALKVSRGRGIGVISGVTDVGGRHSNLPPWQATCKNGPPLNLHFGFSIPLVFSILLLLWDFRSVFR